jgi:hypothetical protein
MKHAVIKQTAPILLLLSGLGSSAQAATAVADDLVLADATACRKPDITPPAPLKNSAERFNVERRYIDLDGSGICVLMDFWVERLHGSDSPGMRTLEHRFLHLVNRKWVPFETDLALFPFVIRSSRTGQTYLVVTPDPAMDDIAAGDIQPEAYLRGTWKTNDPARVDTYSLQPVVQGKSLVYRALAAELAKRAAAGKQTSTELDRIKALQSAAAEAEGKAPPSPSR